MPVEQATQRVEQAQGDLRIPVHMGVTMDGNGRWANQRGKPRTEGHREGIKALKRLIEYAIRYGVSYLTVFSFSSENWRRPKDEVDFIFKLLKRFVETDLQELNANNVRVRILGEQQGLGKDLIDIIARVEAVTADNTGLNLNVAFNYGAKAEIAAAARHLAKEVAAGRLQPEDVTEASLSGALYTGGMPEPDMMLRTGGEQRISNFLIWQAAYAELVFLNAYWPDFSESDFVDALAQFSGRERRFGGIGETP